MCEGMHSIRLPTSTNAEVGYIMFRPPHFCMRLSIRVVSSDCIQGIVRKDLLSSLQCKAYVNAAGEWRRCPLQLIF